MFTKIKRHLHNFLHPMIGEIWCLHRVLEVRSDISGLRELQVTPDYLRFLIKKYKGEGVKFVSIDDIVDSNPCVFPDRQVNISFDDGFVDIYRYAFPIFKELNIPFTVYVTTGFPDSTADIWWEQLADYEDYDSMAASIYKSEKQMSQEMHRITSSTFDPVICKSLSLSWGMIKEMVESGLCTIGSHTVSHSGLTRLSREEVFSELTESKRRLEFVLNIPVKHFSYPHSMYDSSVRSMVKEAGYSTAALGYGGKIRKGDDPFTLNRVYIVQK